MALQCEKHARLEEQQGRSHHLEAEAKGTLSCNDDDAQILVLYGNWHQKLDLICHEDYCKHACQQVADAISITAQHYRASRERPNAV